MLFVCSCSKESDSSLDENINPPIFHANQVEEKLVQEFNFLKFKSFHHLKIKSKEKTLFEQSNFLYRENILYESVLKNFTITRDIDFLKLIHQKEVAVFKDELKKNPTPEGRCSLEVEAVFDVPQKLIKKLELEGLSLNFKIELINNEEIEVPAHIRSAHHLLNGEKIFHLKSRDDLEKEVCHSLLKNRGRLLMSFEEIELKNGENYFFNLEKQMTNHKLIVVLEKLKSYYFLTSKKTKQLELEKKSITPVIDQKKWHSFENDSIHYIFNASDREIVNPQKNWQRKIKHVDKPWNFDLESSNDEVTIYLRGEFVKPGIILKRNQVKYSDQYQLRFGQDYHNICDINNKELITQKSKIQKVEDWKQVPIEIEWDGSSALLWDIPFSRVDLINDVLAVTLELDNFNGENIKINFDTVMREYSIDLTPDYEPTLKIGCDQTYDYSRFQYRVSDKAIYHAEIFYR
jgi:hypothetical protein